jgi:hypothetical protein
MEKIGGEIEKFLEEEEKLEKILSEETAQAIIIANKIGEIKHGLVKIRDEHYHKILALFEQEFPKTVTEHSDGEGYKSAYYLYGEKNSEKKPWDYTGRINQQWHPRDGSDCFIHSEIHKNKYQYSRGKILSRKKTKIFEYHLQSGNIYAWVDPELKEIIEKK